MAVKLRVYDLEGRSAAGQAGSGTWRSRCELGETEFTRPAATQAFLCVNTLRLFSAETDAQEVAAGQ